MLFEMHSGSSTTNRGFCFLANLGRRRPLGRVLVGFILIPWICPIGLAGLICHGPFYERLANGTRMRLWGFGRSDIRETLCVIMRAQ